MEIFIYRLMLFILIFSIIFLIKEAFLFYKALRTKKKNMTNARLWGIGLTITYIITIIITGIAI